MLNKKILFFWLMLLLLAMTAACVRAPSANGPFVNSETETVTNTNDINLGLSDSDTETPLVVDANSDAPPMAPVIVETAADLPLTMENMTTNSTVILETNSNLTSTESADLLFMREEEKLARDVYLALYDFWGVKTFQNIAASEQTHMNSVLSILDSYGLDDPVAANGAGVFVNLELQALYNQLVSDGSESLIAALMVGATIEEIDILDLQTAFSQTDNIGIIQLYTNLSRGSENHLRSLVSTLERQTGTVYSPQYLEIKSYMAIINASTSQGNGQFFGQNVDVYGGQGNGNKGNGGPSNGRGGNNGG